MPKYILHGGETKVPCSSNDRFFEEMVKDAPKGGNVLIVCFACEKSVWKRKFEGDIRRFKKAKKSLTYTLASVDEFKSQFENADVVFIRGGSTKNLIDTVKTIDGVEALLRSNKVIAGSSAGAYLLGDYYYSRDNNGVSRGLGIIPFNIAAHCDSPEYAEGLPLLREVSAGVKPLILLPETEFMMMEY